MGVDGPHKAAGHLQNTPKTRLPLGASGSQSALYVLACRGPFLGGRLLGGSAYNAGTAGHGGGEFVGYASVQK